MKKRWIALMLCVCLLTGMLGGCGGEDQDEPVLDATVAAVSGTAGTRESENYESLFDCDLATKWCVTGFEGAYVIFSFSEPVKPTGYTIATGNDNSSYTGRNPGSWTLYGATGKKAPDRDSRKWELIDSIYSDNLLQDTNYCPYHYDIYDIREKYQHFMLVINKTQGAGVMQISEFALEYNGSDYEFHNSNGSSTGDNDGITDLVGSRTITDGGEYTIGVGEALSLYYARTPISTYYAYFWDIVDGNGNCLTLDRDGPTCQIVGVEPGTVTMKVTLQCTVVYPGVGSDTYDYVYTITINVVDHPTGDQGDVTDGFCPRCHGSKVVGCMACYGDGELAGGRPCSCDGGNVPCPNCGGSGLWFKP